MIFFGHLGLTAGAFKLYEAAALRKDQASLPEIDYRLVLAGAVLPDLIDKPIGALLFISTYHNSRIYAHTLLFSLLLILIGALILRKRKKKAVLVLGMGSLMHLLLDSMWEFPETLLWPFLNIRPALLAKDWLQTLLRFPYRFDDWLETGLESLIENQLPFLFELIGLSILAFVFIKLWRNKSLKRFFKAGKL